MSMIGGIWFCKIDVINTKLQETLLSLSIWRKINGKQVKENKKYLKNIHSISYSQAKRRVLSLGGQLLFPFSLKFTYILPLKEIIKAF